MWTIAKNNYKEIVRDKLLYGIFVVALLVIGSSFFLATISLDENNRVLENIGSASIHLFAVFIAIFIASNAMAKDFEGRALYLLLPKPISRSHYVLGKYLGILLLLITTLAILGGLFSLGCLFIDKTIIPHILINLAFSFLEISLLSALAMLFASFTAPLNASLYTLALFFIGHSLTTLHDFALKSGGSLAKLLTTISYYLLPNLEKFDIRHALLYELPISLSQILSSLLYWALYVSLLLFLTILVIRKREI